MDKMYKMMNNRKGFTLIELIVVIAIIAILAAVAVPRFSGTLTTSKNRAHNANVRMIEGAISLYQVETDTALTAIDDIDDLVPGYLKAVPANPITGGAAYTVTDGVVSPAAIP
jgi:type IV pilus assembly protein PilA